MNAEQAKAFETYWECVRRAQEKVEQYGHVGPDPAAEEKWDEAFAQAYEAIKWSLRPLSKKRLFYVPRRVPFEARTAHQALMRILNPPEGLFGFIHLLVSPEYRRIWDEAVEELNRVQTRKRKRTPSREAAIQRDRAVLVTALKMLHRPDASEVFDGPLTEQQIIQQLKLMGEVWSQPRVSRRMKELFPGGMKTYKKVCKARMVVKEGYWEQLKDGTGQAVPVYKEDWKALDEKIDREASGPKKRRGE